MNIFIRLMVSISLSVLALGVQAEEPVKLTDRCKTWSGMAETIMKARQVGAPMSELMDAAEEANSEAMKKIVIMAYEKPRFSAEEVQKRSTDEFRDEIYLACIKG